jgi:uncharacterized phiE125 gp8 family phage protein
MLPRKVISGPAKEPLSLEEAKRWCRITTDAEDDVVLALVAAARKRVERGTELALITQTVEVVLDGFWGNCALELPMPPLQGVVSVQYLDEAGALQTLAADTYKVSTHRRPGRVWLAYGKSWPATRAEREAVTVTFTAGFGDAASDLPPNLVHAVRMLTAHYDRNREAVLAGVISDEVPEGVAALMAGERIPEAA